MNICNHNSFLSMVLFRYVSSLIACGTRASLRSVFTHIILDTTPIPPPLVTLPTFIQTARMVALPSSKKTHSEKHKQIFRQLLRETPNKSCVDCKTATHPRWASWNLGCFVCIRCSGIHRSMGTHISRVKSVDLDAWTDEQVESMVKWGNEKCNHYWEAKLPECYIPDSSKIENFIRTKYDLKKWASLPKIPDPMSMHVSGSSTASSVQANDGAKGLLSIDSSGIERAHDLPVASGNAQTASLLLDDDFGTFSSAQAARQTTGAQPRNHSGDSDSTQSAGVKSASEPPLVSTPDQRKDLKKSILSLYSRSSASLSSLNFANNTRSYSPEMASKNASRSSPAQNSQLPQSSQNRPPSASKTQDIPNKNDSVSSMTNSLLDLDFGTPAPLLNSTSLNKNALLTQQYPTTHTQKTPICQQNTPTPMTRQIHTLTTHTLATHNPLSQTQTSWNNEWSNIPAAENPWDSSTSAVFGSTASIGSGSGSGSGFESSSVIPSYGKNKDLDDDLYRNVWT